MRNSDKVFFLTHKDEKFAEYKLGQMEDAHQPLEWSPNKFLNVSHCTVFVTSVTIAAINTHGEKSGNGQELLDNLEICNG